VRALETQTDSIKLDVTSGGATIAGRRADSLAFRLQRLSAEIDRLSGIAGSSLANIESFNSVPTADQLQQVRWAMDDGTRAITLLNTMSQTEIPNLYSQFAKGMRARTVAPVTQAGAPRRP
jgi:hypothetical protein